MSIHVFGDSHGNYIFARARHAQLHCHPGHTMHRVGRDGASPLMRHVVPAADDVFVFVFGEIDVRCHLNAVAQAAGRSVEAMADDLAGRYIAALSRAVAALPVRPEVCVMGVVPPIEPLVPNPILPVVGSLAERLVAWFLLNEALEAEIRKTDFKFVPIPKFYRARDGSLKRLYSDGHAHIAKDCTGSVIRAVEAALGRSLAFRPLPYRRNAMRMLLRRMALANRDYAALWTLGETNIDG